MKKNSLVEGTIVSYIMILLTKIVGAVYVIPFYKIIGESGGALYAYAYNIYALFLNISTSGIPTAVAIIVSEYNALKLFKEREQTYSVANKLISCISFCAFLIMFIFAKYIAYFFIGDISAGNSIESVTLVIRVISLCLLVVPFLSVTRGYLQGNKYVSVSSFSQLIEQLSRIFVVLVGSYIAINVLDLEISTGVSVALFGTVLGAICAYLYLKIKIHKNKNEIVKDENRKSTVSNKSLIKKIVFLALPIIIVSITQNIYEIIDLKFILMGLTRIGFSGSEAETIGSVIVSWAPKICTIINALALGLCTSIIPFIVEDFTSKNLKSVNEKINLAMKTILFITIPLSVYIIFNSTDIYYIFYGNSLYGPNVLKVISIISITFSINLVINMILQGMKKHKTVYINTLVGIVVNASLDLPLIYLLNNIGFYPYLGTLIATFIGQNVSTFLILWTLKKEYKFKYFDVIKTSIKFIIPLFAMIFVSILLSIINFNISTYLLRIIKLIICGLLSLGTFFGISYINGTISEILGNNFIDKILMKLKIKK